MNFSSVDAMVRRRQHVGLACKHRGKALEAAALAAWCKLHRGELWNNTVAGRSPTGRYFGFRRFLHPTAAGVG